MREVDPESVALAVDWLDALLRRRDAHHSGRADAMTSLLPAWSDPFAAVARSGLDRTGPFGRLDRATSSETRMVAA